MTILDLLDEAKAVASRLGYRVTEDWLDGQGGGCCTVKGQKRLVVDLALSSEERLQACLEAIRDLPSQAGVALSDELAKLVGAERA